ncbi:MAG: M23 family metallopeptidase [Patescibacteria group bacterium]|jgi:murein DD-endopeptidase MepM/ murein hydrolase activator NlpD
MAIFFTFLKTPIVWLYKFFFRYPFLLTYSLLRKIIKPFKPNVGADEEIAKNPLAEYRPLIIMAFIAVALIGASLSARGLKPENYGRNSLLFKALQDLGAFSESDFGVEEITEGPLSTTTPNYYLEGGAIGPDEIGRPTKNEGIDSLISTTQDQSALISPDITDPNVVVKRRDKIIDYVVQPGDTLSGVAGKFNISTNTVLWENNLTAYSTIRPGQTLKILPVSGITYKVKKGDQLAAIAKKYKVSASEILDFNKLTTADEMQISQVLIIPGAVKEAVAAKPTYAASNTTLAAAKISGAKMQWPTNSFRMTQYFSLRHTGIDIGNKMGQPIYAAEAGVIETAGWNRGGYGNYIIINHGNGLKTLYGHLSKINVHVGQRVGRGEVIGLNGSTGRSTGPHLHFEVRINNRRVNPLGYIR